MTLSKLRWRKLGILRVTEGDWVEAADLTGVVEVGFTDLMPGGKAEMMGMSRPTQQFAPYTDTLARHAAAGTGANYSAISNDYSGTYSSQRQMLVTGMLYDSLYDPGRDARKVIVVAYFSSQYFDLLKRHEGIGRYLAEGKAMVLLFDGKVYRISR